MAYKKTEEVDEYAAHGGARRKKGKGAAANKENTESGEKKVVSVTSATVRNLPPFQCFGYCSS